jgi:hypothetical protein
VREFVKGFAGLTATAKQSALLDEADMKRTQLSELVRGDELDRDRLALLLGLMKKHTKLTRPADLGFIGKDQFRERLDRSHGRLETFRYDRVPKRPHEPVPLPWNAEAGFAWSPDLQGRRLILGVNWSPCIVNPFRRMATADGRGVGGGLDSLLAEQYVRDAEPVIFALHVAGARGRNTDRGKTALVVTE